jgi:hypothetical protein
VRKRLCSIELTLFSPAEPGGTRWPAAGVFHLAFLDRQSQWRAAH